MNSKLDGPFVSAFESDVDGIVKQELITYRVKNKMLRKETTTRRFLENGKDWHDTTSIEPLTEINKNPYARTEYGGPKGAEPTRYGTWENKGKEIDF